MSASSCRRTAKTSMLLVCAATLAACGSSPERPPASAASTAAFPAAGVAVQPAPPEIAPPTLPTPHAAEPAAAASAGTDEPTPPATESPAVAEENSIFFASASRQIDAAGEAKLRRHAARLKDDSRLTVMLVGHTDNLGSTAYNIAIAEQRAAAVAGKLRAMGVSRGQIRYYGVGDEKAGPACKTRACRQKRRRVDLTYPD